MWAHSTFTLVSFAAVVWLLSIGSSGSWSVVIGIVPGAVGHFVHNLLVSSGTGLEAHLVLWVAGIWIGIMLLYSGNRNLQPP